MDGTDGTDRFDDGPSTGLRDGADPGGTNGSAMAADVGKLDEGACGAVTRAGKPCRNRAKDAHAEHGPLCGVHMRAALRQVECAICMCVVRAPSAKRLVCGHTFHRRCIRKWFSRGSLTCPMCRTVCLGELGCSNQRISARLRHLLRVLPRPPNVCFPAYMACLLSAEDVWRAIGITPQEHQLLMELTFQSFTQVHFFLLLTELGM